MISIGYKAIRNLLRIVILKTCTPIAFMKCLIERVHLGIDLKVTILLKVFLNHRERVTVGDNLILNSGENNILIGRQQKFKLWEDGEFDIWGSVFIGAHSAIFNGVEMGIGSVVGIHSMVSKNMHSSETRAGNPARFIKRI